MCVSVCRVFNLFLLFLHRPYLPLPPRLPAYHHRRPFLSPLLLSTLSCRVAVAATAAHPPPPLALLVVRQDNLDTSFISSPCTIEFSFALRTPRLETHQDTPYIPPQRQPPKNIVISSHLASFQHSSTLRQQPKRSTARARAILKKPRPLANPGSLNRYQLF